MKIFVALLVFFAFHSAWADGGDSDKLDLKKLEDKYWSAKDDDFSVVQNRAFPKEGRYLVTLLAGIPINDPYETGNLSGLNVGYHFSERWGVEVSYLSAAFRNNDATTDFIVNHSTVPDHNVLTSQAVVQADWVPLYAKMSFLDHRIIYFDMGLGFGLGQTTYSETKDTGDVSKTGTTFLFSIYQHYFLSPHFAVKFDYRNTWTNEDRYHYHLSSTQSEADRSIGSKSINDSSLLLGVTYFF